MFDYCYLYAWRNVHRAGEMSAPPAFAAAAPDWIDQLPVGGVSDEAVRNFKFGSRVASRFGLLTVGGDLCRLSGL